MKTNAGLVLYAKQKLGMPTIYMLGGFGRILSGPAKSGYHSVDARIAKGCRHTIANEATIRAGIGKYCFDCVGLIKGYLWELSPGRVLYKTIDNTYVADSDLGANGMFNKATVKGTMASMPEVPGLLVWQDGHIGVYIGNGEVIEATANNRLGGFKVLKSQFKDKNAPQYRGTWTHWCECPFIKYIQPAPKPQPVAIKKGDKVQVISPINYDNGRKFRLWFKTYTVIQVNGKRAVIGIGRVATSAINVDLLRKV